MLVFNFFICKTDLAGTVSQDKNGFFFGQILQNPSPLDSRNLQLEHKYSLCFPCILTLFFFFFFNSLCFDTISNFLPCIFTDSFPCAGVVALYVGLHGLRTVLGLLTGGGTCSSQEYRKSVCVWVEGLGSPPPPPPLTSPPPPPPPTSHHWVTPTFCPGFSTTVKSALLSLSFPCPYNSISPNTHQKDKDFRPSLDDK